MGSTTQAILELLNTRKLSATEEELKNANASQEELQKDISTCQDQLAAHQKELKSKISDKKAGQSEFEEMITDTRRALWQ
jgi:peptidoglycan hydrolase CwlO-like protein